MQHILFLNIWSATVQSTYISSLTLWARSHPSRASITFVLSFRLYAWNKSRTAEGILIQILQCRLFWRTVYSGYTFSTSWKNYSHYCIWRTTTVSICINCCISIMHMRIPHHALNSYESQENTLIHQSKNALIKIQFITRFKIPENGTPLPKHVGV